MIICGRLFRKNYPNHSHEPADQQLKEDYNPQSFKFCPYQKGGQNFCLCVLASSFSSKLLLKVCELAQLFGFENSISTIAKIYRILWKVLAGFFPIKFCNGFDREPNFLTTNCCEGWNSRWNKKKEENVRFGSQSRDIKLKSVLLNKQ